MISLRPLSRLMQALGLYACLCFAYSLVLDSALTPEIRASIREASTSVKTDKRAWIAAQEAAYGLDQNLLVRSAARAIHLVWWDFGWTRSGPVVNQVGAAVGPSAQLLGLATLLILAAGIPLGTWAAVHPRGAWSRLVRTLGPLGQALPAWWLGLVVLMATFWALPRSLYSDPYSGLVLSVFTVALLRVWGMAALAAGLIQPGGDAVDAARARGIAEGRVRRRHVLRPSLGPVLKLGGQTLAQAFTGDVLVELIFQRPGLGLLFWQSIQAKQLLVALGCLVVISLGTCLFYAVLDLVDEALDPRVRRDRPIRR